MNNIKSLAFHRLKDNINIDNLIDYFIDVLEKTRYENSIESIDNEIEIMYKLRDRAKEKSTYSEVLKTPQVVETEKTESKDVEFIFKQFNVKRNGDLFKSVYNRNYRDCKSISVMQQIEKTYIYDVSNFVYYNIIKEIKINIIAVCREIIDKGENVNQDIIDSYNSFNFSFLKDAKKKPSHRDLYLYSDDYVNLLTPETIDYMLSGIEEYFAYLKYPISILSNIFKIKEQFTIISNHFENYGKLKVYLVLYNNTDERLKVIIHDIENLRSLQHFKKMYKIQNFTLYSNYIWFKTVVEKLILNKKVCLMFSNIIYDALIKKNTSYIYQETHDGAIIDSSFKDYNSYVKAVTEHN